MTRYPSPVDRVALSALLAEWGQPAYRARQAFEAQRAGADGWSEVGTLPAALRDRLEDALPFWALQPPSAWSPRTARSSGACAPPTASWWRRCSSPTPRGGARSASPARPAARSAATSAPPGRWGGPQPHPGRDRGPGRPRCPRVRPQGARSPTSSSWGWASPCRTSTRCWRRAARSTPRGPGHLGPQDRDLHRGMGAGHRRPRRAPPAPAPGRLAARRRRRHPQRDDADQQPLPDRQPARRLPPLLRPTGRRVFIEYVLLEDVNDSWPTPSASRACCVTAASTST